MNWGIELVFKHKFENLSGPETFPVIITTTLHNDFSLPASDFTLFFHGCTQWSVWQDCNGGNWSRRGQRPQPHNVFLGEGLPACASATALLKAPSTLSSWEMSSIFQDGEWDGLHVSRRSSPTPPRRCIPRTFFPSCQLLPAPFLSIRGREFEVNI